MRRTNLTDLSYTIVRDRPPVVTDDVSLGFVRCQRWLDTSASPVDEYVLVDPAPGAAIWRQTTGGSGSGSGSVTSVAVSVPAYMGSTGGPITGAGTIALSFNNQLPNLFLASPVSGGSGAMSMRALDPLDIPSLSTAKLTSGILPIARGGTNSTTALSGSTIMVSDGTSIVQGAAGTTTTVLHGNASGAPTYGAVSLSTDITGTLGATNGGTGVNGGSAANGRLLIGNGSGFTLAALTAGAGVTVTNGAGSISVAANYIGLVEQLGFHYQQPSASTVTLVLKARYAFTINKMAIQTSGGTVTAQLRINGVSVGSMSAISVSSTPQDVTASSANAVAIGDVVDLVITAPDNAADLQISIQTTRT